MNLKKNNLSYKCLTPLRVSLITIALLFGGLFWQYAIMLRKNHTIAAILSENANLKESLSSIDTQLLELKDTASDVRLFQKELIEVIKDIDQSYPVTFSSTRKTKTALNDLPAQNKKPLLKSTRENIFMLSSSHENLRFETASLLHKALSIRDIFNKTPSMIPVLGNISSDFGLRYDPFTGKLKFHNGVDIRAAIGTPIFAAASGIIALVEKNPELGNLIEISHENGFITQYGHLSATLVENGGFVRRGQVIGLVGNTGSRCKGSHLHFGIKRSGVYEDPKKFMLSTPPNLF